MNFNFFDFSIFLLKRTTFFSGPSFVFSSIISWEELIWKVKLFAEHEFQQVKHQKS